MNFRVAIAADFSPDAIAPRPTLRASSPPSVSEQTAPIAPTLPVFVAFDGEKIPLSLSVEAESTIDGAAAEDRAFLDAAIQENANVGTQIVQVARGLWEISRWDLPVDTRVELRRFESEYKIDLGWERYARALGVDCAADASLKGL